MNREIIATTREASDPAKERESWLVFAPRLLAALFLVWMASRWLFDSIWNLVPDEAYYWVWSQHPAISYLDHPPVVAYLIRLGTVIVGNTELGVRCLFGVTMAAAVVILWRAGREIVADSRAVIFIPVALLASPMVAVTGTIATPDAPSVLFQCAALVTAIQIFNRDGNIRSSWAKSGWLRFGVLMGLALDSKYTSVLLGLSVALALLSCREGRQHLLTPWPWVAAILAGAVFSPVIYWNASHHWASFQFQLHHGTAGTGSPAWKNWLDYIGGQIGVCTPILLGACVWAIVVYWRRRNNPMPVRILLFSATVPLVFFAISATRRRVEGNWPMFAYFPAVMLFARYLGESWRRPRLFWAELAIVVAACMTIVLHAPELVWKKFPQIGAAQWDHLYGWRDLAERDVEPMRQDSPVFTADYEYASELSFYLPTRPDVRPFADPTRPTAFDFFGNQASPASFGRVLLVRRLPKGYDAPLLWKPMGADYDYPSLKVSNQFKDRRQIRRSLIEIAVRKQ